MSDTSRGSNPVGLCCSSTHLVQCEPDEPSLTQGVNNAAYPPEGGPAEPRAYGLKFAIGFFSETRSR